MNFLSSDFFKIVWSCPQPGCGEKLRASSESAMEALKSLHLEGHHREWVAHKQTNLPLTDYDRKFLKECGIAIEDAYEPS